MDRGTAGTHDFAGFAAEMFREAYFIRTSQGEGNLMKRVLLILLVITCRLSADTGKNLSRIEKDTPAHKAAARFRRGANLGNYLEAPRGQNWGASYTADDFRHVRQEGFDHVRLPIAWHHYAGSGPQFKLSDEIFSKADFLVHEALKNNLSAIVNIHHFDEFTSDPAQHKQKFLALWQQIAEHYAKLPASVAFELLNEPKDKATTSVMNRIYADAIRLIRKTNPARTIFVGPGKWNQAAELRSLQLPADDRNLIVTIHCYDPFYFTHQGASWAGPDVKKLRGIRFPGPPREPLKYDHNLPPHVRRWLESYNREPAATNPCSPRV
jgi:endoglucanase